MLQVFCQKDRKFFVDGRCIRLCSGVFISTLYLFKLILCGSCKYIWKMVSISQELRMKVLSDGKVWRDYDELGSRAGGRYITRDILYLQRFKTFLEKLEFER